LRPKDAFIVTRGREAVAMKAPEEIDRLKSKLIEHLEAALKIANKISLNTAKNFIEAAINMIRTTTGPAKR
jgi:hypothetical protein